MNSDHKKLLNAATTYDRALATEVGCNRVMALQHNDGGATEHEQLEHVRWMCWQIHELVPAGEISKANRWLGFIQGVLFKMGRFTLEELKTWKD